MSRAARLTIHLDALHHNLEQVRATAPGHKVVAMIKADACGHGDVRAARALAAVDLFGVAGQEEALTLRTAGIRQPILLAEGFFEADEIPELAAHGLPAEEVATAAGTIAYELLCHMTCRLPVRESEG
jgi:alanine racemase